MPKYRCDVCDCAFPDNATNRRKHNLGQVHINNRKRHYDWFKDPNDYINEQMNKPTCRRYMQTGCCNYKLDCKFGHIKLDKITGAPIFPEELLEWLHAKTTEQEQQHQQYLQQQQQTQEKKKKSFEYKLPSGWKVKELPPSLKPPPVGQEYDWHHVGTWD